MKRIAGRLLAAGLALFMAAGVGCGNENSEISQGAKGGEVLSFWCFSSFAQESPDDKPGTFEQSLIDEFEKANPDVKIELTLIDFTSGPEKLEEAIKNNTPPDILFDAPGRIISYAKRGKLYALDELFDDAFIKDAANDSLLAACKAGDKYYMYPISTAPFYMAFNKGYTDAAGVTDLVREGWTTDDFTNVIKALKEEGYAPPCIYCKDQGGDQGTRAFAANLYSSGIINTALTEYTTGTDKGKAAFEYIFDITEKGCIISGINKTATDSLNDFAAGLASFTLLWGPSQQKQYADLLEKNEVEVLEVPYPSDDGVAELEYLINGFCVFDKGDDERAQTAQAFVKFCGEGKAGERAVLQTGCIPVRGSMASLFEDDPLLNKISGWTRYYAPYYNTVDGFADMRVKWYTTIGAMLTGTIEPAKAAEEFTEYANGTLKAGK